MKSNPQRLWGNSALAPASEALWKTVEAAERLAVTEESLRCFEQEIRITRRRLRGLASDGCHDSQMPCTTSS